MDKISDQAAQKILRYIKNVGINVNVHLDVKYLNEAKTSWNFNNIPDCSTWLVFVGSESVTGERGWWGRKNPEGSGCSRAGGGEPRVALWCDFVP